MKLRRGKLKDFDDGFKVGEKREKEESKLIQSTFTLGDCRDDRNREIRITIKVWIILLLTKSSENLSLT